MEYNCRSQIIYQCSFNIKVLLPFYSSTSWPPSKNVHFILQLSLSPIGHYLIIISIDNFHSLQLIIIIRTEKAKGVRTPTVEVFSFYHLHNWQRKETSTGSLLEESPKILLNLQSSDFPFAQWIPLVESFSHSWMNPQESHLLNATLVPDASSSSTYCV